MHLLLLLRGEVGRGGGGGLFYSGLGNGVVCSPKVIVAGITDIPHKESPGIIIYTLSEENE